MFQLVLNAFGKLTLKLFNLVLNSFKYWHATWADIRKKSEGYRIVGVGDMARNVYFILIWFQEL